MLLRGKESKFKQESGVLLPLSALPSKHGIGTLGKEAYFFAEFLKRANQSYWQLLPLVPIGKGNSPYSSISTFAGEILYIDLEMLIEDGLLTPNDIPEKDFTDTIDYEAVRKFKLPLLKKAADNFDSENKEFLHFKKENNYWLRDFALYMAISDVCGKNFLFWSDGLKYRLPESLQEFSINHAEKLLFYKITQFLFYKQLKRFKEYTTSIGLKLIGDIPIYVAFNSADVWSNSDCFKLGRDMTPVLVSGVPPDMFSDVGQLWGNPIYDWEYQKKNNYLWWQKRLQFNALIYDTIRIDHFRAFADYYTIPYGSPNAINGKWEKGVGGDFWQRVKPSLQKTAIIAEDLGVESRAVVELVNETGFPNMKILQFAFDSDLKDPFLPKNFNKNCVCYTGTHDNDTTLGWYKSATKKEKLLFQRLVPKDKSGSPVLSLILYGMKSKARMVIIPLQDYLQLDSESRINTPGVAKGNWVWRFKKEDITDELTKLILRLSKGRN